MTSTTVTLSTSTQEILRILNLQNLKTLDDVLISSRLIEKGVKSLKDFDLITKEKLVEWKLKKNNCNKILNYVEDKINTLKNKLHNIEEEVKSDYFSKFLKQDEIINEPKNIEIPNINFLKTIIKTVKNPYIIILGISDYSEIDPTKETNLPSVLNDKKLLLYLWRKVYNFKYVYSVTDKIDNESMDCDNLQTYLDTHKSNITNINSKNMNNPIDCLMIFYSGHGDEKSIIFSNGEKYFYKELRDLIDNIRFKPLATKPKLLFLDCCHGKGSIKTRKVDITPMKPRGVGNKTVTVEINKYQDIFKLYGSVSGKKSYGKDYGNLTKSIYISFKESVNENITLGSNAMAINKYVKYFSNSLQTSNVDSTLDYDVIIVPNKM